MVGGAGGVGRLSHCSSREEGAGRPTSPQRVRLTHPGQLLLAVPGGRPPWHFGKETLPKRAVAVALAKARVEGTTAGGI